MTARGPGRRRRATRMTLWLAMAALTALSGPAWANPVAWLAPVQDDRALGPVADLENSTDGALDGALRLATALVAPGRQWLSGRPDAAQVADGCDIVEVRGHRLGPVHYAVTVRHLPQGPVRTLELDATGELSVFELAQALALHTAFLLAEPPPSPGLHGQPVVTPPILKHVVVQGWSVSLGPTVSRAWTRAFSTEGTEIGATLRTLGHLQLGAAIGVEASGAAHGTLGRSQVRVVPATLLAGGGWSVGSLHLGASAGVRVAAWSVDGRMVGAEESHDIDISAVAEGRVAWQWRDLLSIALTLRPSYSLEGAVPQRREPAPTRAPPMVPTSSPSPSAQLPRGLVQAGAAIVVPL
jgi:hypothetical protein